MHSAVAPDKLLAAPVRSLMREVVSALAPDTSLAAAARMLAERHVGGAPVVDPEGHLLGVVTRSDLLGARNDPRPSDPGRALYYVLLHGETQLVGSYPDLDSVPDLSGVVADVMSRGLITVHSDAPVHEAIGLMVAREVHRVLVVDGGKLLGVLSSMDVLRALVPSDAPGQSSGF